MAADEAKARGNSAFSTGNFTQAIIHFTEAINISPNNHLLYSNRSAAYASLSNFSLALTDAQKTIDLQPDWPKGYSRLGASYMGLKNYSHAISSYQKGLQIDPDNDFLKSCLTHATSLSQKRVVLKKAFKSAKQSGEMLKLLKEMEPCFDESELGMEYWAIARELSSDSVDLKNSGIQEKVLFYGKRALKALLDDNKKDYYTDLPCIRRSMFSNFSVVNIINGNVDNHGSSLFVASVYALLGAACLDLGRLDESLSYLDQANGISTKLEADESENHCAGNCVISVLDLTHQELFKIKERTGRLQEGVHHLRKKVEFREMCMEEGCLEIGKVCHDVCSVCMYIMDTKQARPFCLKALEIFIKHVGTESMEVAKLRRKLALIYMDSEEHELEKAIEQNRLALGIMKKITPSSPDLLTLEITISSMMLEMGRDEEVIEVLKGVVSRGDIGERQQAMSYLTMAKASCHLGKFSDAKKYMRTTEGILDKKGLDTSLVAMSFADISAQYMSMNDLETAMSYSKRALSFPKLPERVLAECSSRFFSLVFRSGKEKEELSYMKDVVEKLKEKFGPMHREVGFGYISLGAAYMKSSQPKSAVKFMAMAKEIMDATVGHLSLYCSVKDWNHQVITILERVIKGCEGKEEFLDIAVEILNNLKG